MFQLNLLLPDLWGSSSHNIRLGVVDRVEVILGHTATVNIFRFVFFEKESIFFFLLWNTSDDGWRINLLKICTNNSKYTKKRFTCLNYASKSTQLFFIRFFLNKGYFSSLLRLNYFYLCLSNYHNVRSPLHVINKFGIIHLKRQVLARLYSLSDQWKLLVIWHELICFTHIPIYINIVININWYLELLCWQTLSPT